MITVNLDSHTIYVIVMHIGTDYETGRQHDCHKSWTSYVGVEETSYLEQKITVLNLP